MSERLIFIFFFQAEDGIRDYKVTGVQTCALPIYEINNPLTVVVGSLELLARHLGSDQQERRWLDRANAAAQRIRDIVARMTRITRLERTDARPGLPPMLDIHKSSDVESPEAP